MALINKVSELIHSRLLPLQQMFHSYEKLANGNYRFSSKIFKKCALAIGELIEVARDLTEEMKDGNGN